MQSILQTGHADVESRCICSVDGGSRKSAEGQQPNSRASKVDKFWLLDVVHFGQVKENCEFTQRGFKSACLRKPAICGGRSKMDFAQIWQVTCY